MEVLRIMAFMFYLLVIGGLFMMLASIIGNQIGFSKLFYAIVEKINNFKSKHKKV